MFEDRPLLSRDGAPRRHRSVAPMMVATAAMLAMAGSASASERKVVVGANGGNCGGGGGGGSWQDYVTRVAQACNPNFMPPPNCPVPGAPPGYGDACNKPRWVPVTIANTAVVAAGGTGTATMTPQANFKLARVSVSAALAADIVIQSIAVGGVPNILPGIADGLYFSIASNQDGTGRVDAPMATPGQTIVITYTSAAGHAAGVGRFTLEGAYAGPNGY